MGSDPINCAMICWRNVAGYGALIFGISDSFSHKDQVSTKASTPGRHYNKSHATWVIRVWNAYQNCHFA